MKNKEKNMNALKPFVTVIFLVSLSLAVFSCGKKDKRQPIRSGRGTVAGTTPTTSIVTTGTTWGEITGGSDFQERVSYLVSAERDPKELGTVSGQSGQSTGVRFVGHVETQSLFSPTSTVQQVIRPEASGMMIFIWHSLSEQSGGYAIEIAGSASGTIQGNRAVITFSDSYGSLTFDGTFAADYFQGIVKFDNSVYYYGQSPGAAGVLGNFRVSTCGFFKCN